MRYVVMLDGQPIAGGNNRKSVVRRAINLLERERLTILDDPSSHPAWNVENVTPLLHAI